MLTNDIEREQHSPGRFDRMYPWLGPNQLDENKIVTFSQEVELLTDPTTKSPAAEDQPFGGKNFVVELNGCDTPQQVVLDIKPGNSVSGKTFKVEVVAVSFAQFQDTH